MSTNSTRFFIYAGFELNQTYIAKVLCENLDKPELNCKGKCFLSKKIKEAEEKEKHEERQNLRKVFQESFLVTNGIELNRPESDLIKNKWREISSALPTANTDILHPPPTYTFV